MDELQAAMNVVLANTLIMYFRAHSYHWNVEGPNFSDYHQFFGTLYEELHGAVDPIAEHIRALKQYAPVSMRQILMMTTCSEDMAVVPKYTDMFMNLNNSNDQVIDALRTAHRMAEVRLNSGLMQFLATRLDTHAKHAWMLQSLIKPAQE